MSILIVDDQIIFRSLFSTALTLDGLETRTAELGTTAIAMILEDRPELIVLDYTLIDMECDDFLEWLRSEFLVEPIPVLLAISMYHESWLTMARRYRVEHYLFKAEYTPEGLRQKVRKMLRRTSIDENVARLARMGVRINPVIERIQRERAAERARNFAQKHPL